MLFFGWGRRSKSWSLTNGQRIVAVWRYAHIVWYPLAWHIRYHLLNDSRSQDSVITRHAAAALLGTVPNIGLWQRYGMVLLFLAIFAMIAWPPGTIAFVPLLAIGVMYGLIGIPKFT
ncbi:MAG: hypothetical protein KGI78_04610 [Patescibacteria group bacterium]|nr:hypothetical protein [Patescibacteria group bacterium]MDE1945543.1 hypothetical protein [Patescibacteria group bacterium]MDE2058091.1 hypothetical protein [Patescibacteria group bacterium]